MEQSNHIADLTDALGEVRDRIKTLKTEEAALRDAILEARPNGPVSGHAVTLKVRVGTSRRFDAKRLPDHIREDPQYWNVSETLAVMTIAVETDAAGAAPLRKAQEEFDAFEPF